MKKTIVNLLSCVIALHISTAESVYSLVYQDSVVIGNSGVSTNCGSHFIFVVTISNDTITVSEIDTSMRFATCTCTFTLTTTLSGLDPGHYWVMVYRKPSPMFPYDTLLFIGTTEFTFGNSDLVYSMRGIQSACTGWGPDEVKNEIETAPHEFKLSQNYPNPFNPSTTIRFNLPVSGFMSLKVFDLLGREIVTLKSEVMQFGEHSVRWDASSIPSGMYLYRLQSRRHAETKKLILLR